MFSNSGFGRKLTRALAVSLFVIAVIMGVTSYFTFARLGNIEDRFSTVIDNTTPAIIALNQIKTHTYFLLLEANEYVLSPSEEHTEEFMEASVLLQWTVDSYTLAEEGEEEMVLEIADEAIKIVAFGESILELKDSGASQVLVIEKLEELDELAEAYMEILNAELFRDTVDLVSSQKAVANEVERALNVTIILILLTLLFAIIAGFVIPCAISSQSRSNRVNTGNTIRDD